MQQCVKCGTRKLSFSDDPVGDMLSYLCEPRPWLKNIVAIAHNAIGFHLNFILSRATFLKLQLEVFWNGLMIMWMRMEYLAFVYSIFFTFALRRLPEAFGLSASKYWYPHYFNRDLCWIILDRFQIYCCMARPRWPQVRGKRFTPDTSVRSPMFLITDTFWKLTIKMTSHFWGKHNKYLGESLFR